MTAGSLNRSQAKSGFLDRARIVGLLDGVTLSFYNRLGGHIRKVARNSMKRGTTTRKDRVTGGKRSVLNPPSKPGRAPRYRSGLIRENLFYSVDAGSRSLVIGPVRLNALTRGGRPVPALHEFGGSRQTRAKTITVDSPPGRNANGRFFKGGPRKVRIPAGTANYPARPYMRPALEKGLLKSRDFLRDAVSRNASAGIRRRAA